MKNLLGICFAIIIFFLYNISFATHNRAGEITYCHVSGLTYQITITTYTNINACAADRCQLEINFGDGDIDTVTRSNGGACPSGCGSCSNCGEPIPGTETKKNIYTTTHTYSGVGTYIISVIDPTRNAGVLNIPNSVDVPFYLETKLIIFPGLGNNCSPYLEYPPIDVACIGLTYEHSPGAVDPDGDSLVFSLISCKGQGGLDIPGFVFPHLTPFCTFGTLTINPNNGLITWDYPICQGEFNLAILIEEYRNGYLIGSLIRDMQILVASPCPNNPPVIKPIEPICALAGTLIEDTIIATDPDIGQVITLSASGLPLSLSYKPAQFNNTSAADSVASFFTWDTDCEHVRPNEYQVTFKAEDNHPTVKLVDYETLPIKIIAPPTQITDISAQGNEITIDWEISDCANASCYNVYRRIDSSGYIPLKCETGVPVYTGYELISNIENINNHLFIDNNTAIVHGQKYCYIVTYCFNNGAESQASNEVCIELKQDVPLITHVSISKTDIATGKDTIRWAKPTELDTLTFAGPYQYKVLRSTGFNTPSDLVYTSALYNFLHESDTTFIDTLLNTQTNQYNYSVEIYYDTDKRYGVSDPASSVFLSSTPTDNALILQWNEQVPWTNEKYWLYKKDDLGAFNLIDTVYGKQYTDTGLVNQKEYCYYVVSVGKYSIDGILNPLINYSQIHCNAAQDNVAPCAPSLDVLTDNCKEYEVILQWNKPDISCADDVVKYHMYYSPHPDSAYTKLDSILNSTDTSYTYYNTYSIAGCYYVTALDTFLNESTPSDTMCVDNCPEYTLPNVFTPGSDGLNDLFMPFPYRYIAEIDLNIYNRWGEKVFYSSNPNITWDGKHMKNGKSCSAGVYYYVCEVSAIQYTGIEKFTLHGYIHVMPEEIKPSGF